MPPQDPGTVPTPAVIQPSAPQWFKILFMLYASILVLGTFYFAVKGGLSIVSQIGAFSSFLSESYFSSHGFWIIGLYALAALISVLIIAYGVGLLRLKRWTLPVFFFVVVTTACIDIFGLTLGNYDTGAESIGHILSTVVILGLGFGAWQYRAAFIGPSRKLWLQIPLLLIFVSVAFFSTLAHLYTDDASISDADLLLADVSVLPESDNAHFALPRFDLFSTAERTASDQARELYRMVEQGKDIDIDAASTTLGSISHITDQFIEASKKPGYQCPSSVNSHGIETEICPLNELRKMAEVVAFRSYVEAKQGKKEAALESAYTPARLGQKVSAHNPLLIEHLTGITLVKIGVESVDRVVDNAAIASSSETIARELQSYTYDGSSLENSFKREYLSGKETFRPFEKLGGYAWHHNSTNNALAQLSRRNIEIAKTECGVELEKKFQSIEARAENTIKGSVWWTIIKPNGIGAIITHGMGVSVGGPRKKECEVNALIEMIQKRLQ